MEMNKCKKCEENVFTYETGKCISCTFQDTWIKEVKKEGDERF